MSKYKIFKEDIENFPHCVIPLDNKVQRRSKTSILSEQIRHKIPKKNNEAESLTKKEKKLLINGRNNRKDEFKNFLKKINDPVFLKKLCGDENKKSRFIRQAWHSRRQAGYFKSYLTFIEDFEKIIIQKREELLIGNQ